MARKPFPGNDVTGFGLDAAAVGPGARSGPMRVAVIGAGYVGLVQAGGLACLGHRVRVGERSPIRLRVLEDGGSPIYEPGLDQLLDEGTDTGLLTYHASNREAVAGARVVFITLPTPSSEDGSVDTTILYQAIDRFAGSLAPGAVIALKSTVPVGTAERVGQMPAVANRGVRVVSNPEFLREGRAVDDFMDPDRIVIGADHPEAADLLASGVYEGLPGELVVTDPASAEMIKYAANAYLAARISFVNSIANLCESVGADAVEVLTGMGHDHRIGPHYLSPGPGYGGSCLPKDTRALLSTAERSGYDFELLRAVIDVNDRQRQRIVDKVVAAMGGAGDGGAVGMWGLSFKAGTDDLRESPAVDLAERLLSAGATVRAYDPKVTAEIAGIEAVPDAVAAASGADVLLVATEWDEFRHVDLSEVRRAMRGSAVVDARNLLDRWLVEAVGLSYTGVGTGR